MLFRREVSKNKIGMFPFIIGMWLLDRKTQFLRPSVLSEQSKGSATTCRQVTDYYLASLVKRIVAEMTATAASTLIFTA